MSLAMCYLPHSVTCHSTQVNIPCLNPSQTGQYSIYLPWRDGLLSWAKWLVTHRDGLPHPQRVTRPSARPEVELTTCWSHVRGPNHYTAKLTWEKMWCMSIWTVTLVYSVKLLI